MSIYTVRVELPGGSTDDYEILNGKMESLGFTRTIPSVGRGYYSLPTGEYSFDGYRDIGTATQSAVSIAISVSSDAKVLVTKAIGRKWFNLDMV